MDRDLGATSAAIGLYFQKGRKDPFLSASDWKDTETVAYDYNSLSPTGERDYNTLMVATEDLGTDSEHLAYSINNPLSYITAGTKVSTTGDWYSKEALRSSSSNNQLWLSKMGANGSKSASGPCPEGWRLPKYSNSTTAYPWDETTGTHPWERLAGSNFPAVIYGRKIDGVENSYYPFGGRRTTTGNIASVGTDGYYSSATMTGGTHKIPKGLTITGTSVSQKVQG